MPESCGDFRRTWGISRRVSRRQVLAAGGLGLFGLTLPELLRADAVRAAQEPAAGADGGFGRAKACILLFCWGGPSQLETWDLKPDAPAETRSRFRPINTTVAGIQVGEHLPLLARHAHKMAIIRSMHHDQTAHAWGKYYMLTGHAPPVPFIVTSSNWPTLGSMVGLLKPGNPVFPTNVTMPCRMFDGTFHPGQYAGFLGAEHQPFVYRPKTGIPYKGKSPDTGIAEMEPAGGMTTDRMSSRRSLLAALDLGGAHLSVSSAGRARDKYVDKAVGLLSDPRVRRAFDVENEPAKTLELYGNHVAGRSMLTARRLVESGVRLVSVICAAGDLNGSQGDNWDTHGNLVNRMKNDLLPPLDRGASALLADLSARGMLDDTLVVICGEFGRTPKPTGDGRDHWPGVYSTVLAGGGIAGGQVYGASDKLAAFPAVSPVGPADFVATIFHALGIPPHAELKDQLGRIIPACDGRAIREIFA
jgi:hypothetical protein